MASTTATAATGRLSMVSLMECLKETEQAMTERIDKLEATVANLTETSVGKIRSNPKRPKSAIKHYTLSVQEGLKKKYPDLTKVELAEKITTAWERMSEAKQKPFYELEAADRQRYKAEKEEMKKAGTYVKKPKRALSAYNFFVKDEYHKVREENSDLQPSEVMAEVGRLWRELSDADKKPYVKLAEADKQQRTVAVA